MQIEFTLVRVNVEAIQKASRPGNAPELKAYLGVVTLYAKFIPNMSSAFYELLQKQKKWNWSREAANSIEASKKWLTQYCVLTF